jgi:4-amino-4-deoxy-L-arabinose transferase-like glycosyltransferase
MSKVGTAPLVGTILVVAAALQFAFLGQHSLWSDEIFVVWISRFSWRDLLQVATAVDFHPPFYYLLMKTWIGIAGAGETALRIPSAIFSVLSVGLTYGLMRRMASVEVGLLSALLVGVSPFHIMAGQEARMYPLVGALVVGSTWAVAEAVERGGILRWGVYVVLAVLTAYTSYLASLALVAHGVWVVVWERRCLARWSAAMGVAAVLYAPWMPALWTQLVQAPAALPTTPGSEPWLRGLDLLGLFAFGGSLFGTAGYFSPGTLDPVSRVVVLLPFLLFVSWGVAAVARDRRQMALIGLPPAVIIGIAWMLSLLKPTFLPRWFSFLVPFYAMFLAAGIVVAANHVRANRDRALAWFTVWVLVYSLPVLERYYFEPATWAFRWRAAAELVAHRAKPGDFFLYADSPTEETFSYYFRGRHPSMTFDPVGKGPDANGWTPGQARDLAGRYHRVWLVTNGPISALVQQRVLVLATAFRPAGFQDFSGAGVYLFEARQAPAN